MEIKCSYSKIEKIADLKKNPSNENEHTTKQIKTLAKILDKTGQRSPIVVSNQSGLIVKGHGRLEAMNLLKVSECAIDYQDYDSPMQEFEDRVADNEIARHAKFDLEKFEANLDNFDQNLGSVDLEDFGLIDFFKQVAPSSDGDNEDNLQDEEKFLIVIECADELAQSDLFEELQLREIECKLMS